MKKFIISLLLLVYHLDISAQFSFLRKDKSQEIKIENDSIVTYIYLNEKGDTSEVDSYLNNLRHGYSMELNSNGEKEIEYYKNGKKDGAQRIYYPNGRLKSERNYVKNVEEGLRTMYYKNGTKKFEGYFKEGKETGKIIYYHPNGKQNVVRIWNDSIKDKVEKQFIYYENGNLKDSLNFSSLFFKGQWHHKVLNGKKYTYSSEGHEAITEFQKGFSTGFSTYKSPNGKLLWKSIMLNDSTQQFYYYDSEGSLTDSTIVKFWKPFKNPLIRSDSFKYRLDSYGHFDYLSDKEKYKPNAIVEKYHSNGNLKYRANNGFHRTYYPNGKLSRIGKGSEDSYQFQWEKRYRYSNNRLVEESYLSGSNGRTEPLIKTEYKVNKDTSTTIQVYSYRTNPQCLLRSAYLNGKHEWTTLDYMNQEVKLQRKSATKYLVSIKFRRYYKNYLRRFFKQNRKKRYRIKLKENSLSELRSFFKAGKHSLVDKKGITIFSFDLIDSTIVKNVNIKLPNGKTVYRTLESNGSHPSTAFIKGLGFQLNRNDSISIQESIFPNNDTIISFYSLNENIVYSKFYDEYVLKNPKTNNRIVIELYESGKVKKRENKSNNNTMLFYKNGNISWESCYDRDPNNYKFVNYHYKNGNPKLKYEQNNNPKLNQRILFRRNGSLHMVYTDSSTVLYNRKGDLIALAGKTNSTSEQVIFVRNDNQKEIIYNNGRRQYKSITFIKAFPKKSFQWLKKSSRNTYFYIKTSSKKSYRFLKIKVKKLFSKKKQDSD